MKNLVAFLLRYQGIMLFVLLEVASFYLFLTNSSYQRAAFLNSANAYAGAVLARRTQVADYFRLGELNQQLLADNARLRQQLFPPDRARREADSLPVGRDTLGRLVFRQLRPKPDSLNIKSQALSTKKPDTLLLGGARLPAHNPTYPLIPARVINNMLRSVDNYLTLNVGLADGVEPGLGVVSAAGVVGRVKAASAHYATVTSLLHSKSAVAAKIKRDGTFGSVIWPGEDYRYALLDNIPRQNRLVAGDSVVTSGYNAIFPEGVLVGVVESFVKEPDKNFWTVRLRLGTDFSRLTYVYVMHKPPRAERDSLEAAALAPEPLPARAPKAASAAGVKLGGGGGAGAAATGAAVGAAAGATSAKPAAATRLRPGTQPTTKTRPAPGVKPASGTRTSAPATGQPAAPVFTPKRRLPRMPG